MFAALGTLGVKPGVIADEVASFCIRSKFASVEAPCAPKSAQAPRSLVADAAAASKPARVAVAAVVRRVTLPAVVSAAAPMPVIAVRARPPDASTCASMAERAEVAVVLRLSAAISASVAVSVRLAEPVNLSSAETAWTTGPLSIASERTARSVTLRTPAARCLRIPARGSRFRAGQGRERGDFNKR